MRNLLSPAASSGVPKAARPSHSYLKHTNLRRPSVNLKPIASPSLFSPLSLTITHRSDSFSSPQSRDGLGTKPSSLSFASTIASSSISTGYASPNDESAKIAQVAKRLKNTSRHFKRYGILGFWCQLVCTLVASVLLSLSFATTRRNTNNGTCYTTAAGIVAAFVSVFLSFGYIQLADKLKRTANEPSKAPSRGDVLRSVKNSIALNILGMGAAILGMQGKVGSLITKALTSTANPYIQGFPPGNTPVLVTDAFPPGSTPVLAIDAFLVQASANTVLSHFLGLVFSLLLLRLVTLPPPESPKAPKLT